MQVYEIKEAKLLPEQTLAGLLEQFEDDCGVVVTEVNLRRTQYARMDGTVDRAGTQVDLTVEI